MAPDQGDAERTVTLAPIRTFRGLVWRTHWREVAALDWSLSLRTSGRYHRGLDLFPEEQTFPALYTSLTPEIAIWEMVRRSAARNLAFLQNNVLSKFEVEIQSVLDLTVPTAAGLTTADLTGPDIHRCRALAWVASRRGCQALLVPSAALPGTNLVILPRNLPDLAPLRFVHSLELPLEGIMEGEAREVEP